MAKRMKLNRKTFDLVHMLRNQGLTHRQIGEVVGRSGSTVCLWLKYQTIDEYKKERREMQKEYEQKKTTRVSGKAEVLLDALETIKDMIYEKYGS